VRPSGQLSAVVINRIRKQGVQALYREFCRKLRADR